jgi:GTP-binding protein
VRVTAARFLGAAAVPGGGPAPGPPEIAVAGRSNVGKSSFLNTLLGRRGLARTSRTPGRTRQLNFFLVNERFTLVDLPGYGFAVGPEAERQAWGPLVEGYLRGRPTLRGVVVLVDVRRGIEADEEELLAFLRAVGLPAAVVATKLDKLGRGARPAALAALGRRLGAAETALVAFSARSGEGREAVWEVLRRWLAAPPRAEAGACGAGRRGR